ncbi:hypothetical protein KIW84_034197 [Lathyrus oleraceus]|uniref:Spindle pole body-associated protein Vik1/Cik1 microtubule binding domain-containing protein n=1 Tax=Pisum sativum TaxID=3888 RepID=A0A9D5B0X3_PEA|nr:hypothetical protein KIW84_034197 [Pisum sativum]
MKFLRCKERSLSCYKKHQFSFIANHRLSKKYIIYKEQHVAFSDHVKFTTESFSSLDVVNSIQLLGPEYELLKKKYLDESSERKRLYNEIIEIKGNIRVFCRCRPLSVSETRNEYCILGKKSLMDAADKCVSVDFAVLQPKSSHLIDSRENVNNFSCSISHLDNCSFQTYITDFRSFNGLVKRSVQFLKDDMDKPLVARLIFKDKLIDSVNHIFCNLLPPLMPVYSRITVTVTEKINLASLDEGLIMGDSFVVTASSYHVIKTNSDDTDQSDMNVQLFQGLSSVLHSTDQEEVKQAPDNRLINPSVNKHVENSVQACLLKIDVTDYDPLLHERGFHQKLNVLVKESLQLRSVFPKKDGAFSELSSSQQPSSKVIGRGKSANNVVVVDEEILSMDITNRNDRYMVIRLVLGSSVYAASISEKRLEDALVDSSSLSGLETHLSEVHKFLIATDVVMTFTRAQFEVHVEELTEKLHSACRQVDVLCENNLEVESELNVCLGRELNGMEENMTLSTSLDYLKSELAMYTAQCKALIDQISVTISELKEHKSRTENVSNSSCLRESECRLEVVRLEQLLESV